MTRGNNRQTLFRDQSDFETYSALVAMMKKECAFEVYHYCLMGNHVHFVIRFLDKEGLQKVMQRVNLIYAKRYRIKYRYCGHVFQDRFKSFPVEKDSYLLECGRYIERNPLKAKLVGRLRDYPWSSYRYYAEGERNDLITANPLYEGMGATPEERQMRYREYLSVERPYEKLIEDGLLRS